MDLKAFGPALMRARQAIKLPRSTFAVRIGRAELTVQRWELAGTTPTFEDRVKALKILADVPRPLLATLAAAGDVALDSVLPLPPAPPPAEAPAPLVPPLPAARAMDADAQTAIDDAVREAAEDLDLTPRLLRPVLSRLLDRIERTGAPMNAAARMVLGVPKREKDPTKRATV